MKHNKEKQLLEVAQWLDRLYEIAETVILENQVDQISAFELVNILNVRLFVEIGGRDNSNTTRLPNKPNLFVLKPKQNDEN